ncbi:MAG: YfhO family protein [Flavisolibacter sp.]
MKKGIFPQLLPHIIAVVVFLLVALVFCSPVLQGMVLQQHDIIQWQAMAKSSFDFKEANGHFPLWTNSLFSGMPAYQIAMDSGTLLPPQALYHVLTLFLPQPISLFFLACISFYFLAQVLRINPWLAIFAALAYAYATYNPIIIVAGHVTKMQSIAVMPALIGSLLVIFERKNYIVGLALTAVSATLLIGMNHPQIVYYTLLALAIMSIAFAVVWIRRGEVRHMILAFGLALGGGILGVLSNAVPLFTTYEYSKATIRGGTELADSTSNATKDGLSEDYAFSYSMKKPEPLVMMVPNMYGGSSEPVEMKMDDSKTMETLQSMPQELAGQLAGARTAYWGGIGFTSGPPYVGAIICFLGLLGFFVIESRHKWWILAATVLTIMMSWGSFFEGFNRFLLHTLPMYNKFRAPSMIIVVPTLLLNILAALTLQKIIFQPGEETWDRFKKGLYLTGGVLLVLLGFYASANFMSEQDGAILSQLSSIPEQVRPYVEQFLSALKDDRKSLFFSSFIRSLFFILAVAVVLYLSLKKKLTGWAPFFIIGVLAFIDLIVVDSHYFNKEHFTEEYDYQNNFVATPADQQIMQDKSFYRVFDVRQGLSVALGMQGAMPSYFHKSIGGYHPAKLSIYQDLIEHQLMKFPDCMPVINMLNTKYIIQQDQTGKDQVYTNPDALGDAWFVKGLRFENDANAVMNALSNFNSADTAILFATDKNLAGTATADSTGRIELVENKNDEILYRSHSTSGSFAVFSEIFYNKGWHAYVDGKETPIIRTNYVLRGLALPAGDHKIRFEFHPTSYYTGRTVANIANIIIWLVVLGALFVLYRRRQTPELKNG